MGYAPRMGRFNALRQAELGCSSVVLLAAAIGPVACADGQERDLTMTVSATAELQSDGTLRVEGAIHISFPPADAGPSEFDDAEVMVAPRGITWARPEPRELQRSLEGGSWPVERGDV